MYRPDAHKYETLFPCKPTFETGSNDFHHMIYTILKIQDVKLPPPPKKKVKYRDYRNFSEENFRSCLVQKLSTNRPYDLKQFEETFDVTLSKHAPYISVKCSTKKCPVYPIKIFERLIHSQMLPLTKPKLSNLFCVASGKEIVHNTLS